MPAKQSPSNKQILPVHSSSTWSRVCQLLSLLLDRLDDPRVAVANVAAHELRVHVEVLLSVGIPEIHALGGQRMNARKHHQPSNRRRTHHQRAFPPTKERQKASRGEEDPPTLITLPLTMEMGAVAPCTDHEKKVCF
jgi:hypothetical protein